MSMTGVLTGLNLSTLPRYKQLRQSGVLDFVVDKEFGHYRGRFSTSEEATNSLPAQRRENL
jgi:hypothetical protein